MELTTILSIIIVIISAISVSQSISIMRLMNKLIKTKVMLAKETNMIEYMVNTLKDDERVILYSDKVELQSEKVNTTWIHDFNEPIKSFKFSDFLVLRSYLNNSISKTVNQTFKKRTKNHGK